MQMELELAQNVFFLVVWLLKIGIITQNQCL